jgi:hypothetical protein
MKPARVVTEKMRFAFYVALIGFVAPAFSPSMRAEDGEFKFWNEAPQLTWGDFKMAPPPNQKFSAKTWVGFDVSGRCVGGRFFFDVSTFFNRDSSWVKPVKGIDKLLRHEQGHFDLAEISARELRRSLQELPEPCADIEQMKKNVNVLTTYSRMQLGIAQSDYDKETRNGSNSKKQKKWDEKIAQRLAELAEYMQQ